MTSARLVLLRGRKREIQEQIFCAANPSDTERLPNLVIAKPENPRLFENENFVSTGLVNSRYRNNRLLST